LLTILLLAISAFSISSWFTPFFRDFAIRHAWVDIPDQKRKRHLTAVPRIGGVAIMLAYAGSFAIWGAFQLFTTTIDVDMVLAVCKLLPAAVIVFAIGLVDDRYTLRPWQKALGVTLAGVFACMGGIEIRVIANHPIGHIPGVIITIVWLVACSNAFNLIDGLDGLASGLGLLAAITTLVAGLIYGDMGLVVATVPLVGALLGFLLFNFNPASIFLGDCGSLTLGFMLGCFAVIWSQKAATLLGISGPLIALCVPLIDTGLAIARRVLRRQSIFSADSAHIHHRLLDRGLTHRRVVLLLYAIGGLAACFSIVQSLERHQIGGVIILVFCLSVCLGIQYLGYIEFSIAFRVFRDNSFLRTVKLQISLNSYENAMRAAGSLEEFWQTILTAARELGLSQVLFHVAKSDLHFLIPGIAAPRWIVEIAISDTEWVRLGCPYALPAPEPIAPFAKILYRVLLSKAAEFNLMAPRMPGTAMTVAEGTRLRESFRSAG
jgi:UDP-GlcNAc:undecaprenyl-phosphate/decaprenyl-phosphate GlcNAc-1-phosphate transferase